jgi:hypothetical protein
VRWRPRLLDFFQFGSPSWSTSLSLSLKSILMRSSPG